MLEQTTISNNIIYSLSGDELTSKILNANMLSDNDIITNVNSDGYLYTADVSEFFEKNIKLNEGTKCAISKNYITIDNGSSRIYSVSVIYNNPLLEPTIYFIKVRNYETTPSYDINQVNLSFSREDIPTQSYLNGYNYLTNNIDGKLVFYKGVLDNQINDNIYYIFVYANKFYTINLNEFITSSSGLILQKIPTTLTNTNVDNYYYEARIKYNIFFSMFYDVVVIDANNISDISEHKILLFYNFRFDNELKYYLRMAIINNINETPIATNDVLLSIFERNGEPFTSLKVWNSFIHSSLGDYEFYITYTGGSTLNSVFGAKNINKKNLKNFTKINADIVSISLTEDTPVLSRISNEYNIKVNQTPISLTNIEYFMDITHKSNSDLVFFASVFNDSDGFNEYDMIYGYATIDTKTETVSTIRPILVKGKGNGFTGYFYKNDETYSILNNFVSSINVGTYKKLSNEETEFNVISLTYNNARYGFLKTDFVLTHENKLKPPTIQDLIIGESFDEGGTEKTKLKIRFTAEDDWTNVWYSLYKGLDFISSTSVSKNDVIPVNENINTYDISRSNLKIETDNLYGIYTIELEIRYIVGSITVVSDIISKTITLDPSGFLAPLPHFPTMLDQFVIDNSNVNFNLEFDYYKELNEVIIRDSIQYAEFSVTYIDTTTTQEIELFNDTYYTYSDNPSLNSLEYIRSLETTDLYAIKDISFSIDAYNILTNPFIINLTLGIISSSGLIKETRTLTKDYNSIRSLQPAKPTNLKLSIDGNKTNPTSSLIVSFTERSQRWDSVEIRLYDTSYNVDLFPISPYSTNPISRNDLSNEITEMGDNIWFYKIPVIDICNSIGAIFSDEIILEIQTRNDTFVSSLAYIQTTLVSPFITNFAISSIRDNYYYDMEFDISSSIAEHITGFKLLYKRNYETSYSTWGLYGNSSYSLTTLSPDETKIIFNTKDCLNPPRLFKDSEYYFKVEVEYGTNYYGSSVQTLITPLDFIEIDNLQLTFDNTTNTLTTNYQISCSNPMNEKLLSTTLEYVDTSGNVILTRNIPYLFNGINTGEISFNYVESDTSTLNLRINYPLAEVPILQSTTINTPITPYNVEWVERKVGYKYFYDIVWKSPTPPGSIAFIDVDGIANKTTEDNKITLSFGSVVGNKTLELYKFYTYNNGSITLQSDKYVFTIDTHKCVGIDNNITDIKTRVYGNGSMTKKRLYALGTRRMLYR